jgi:hypothetical protein
MIKSGFSRGGFDQPINKYTFCTTFSIYRASDLHCALVVMVVLMQRDPFGWTLSLTIYTELNCVRIQSIHINRVCVLLKYYSCVPCLQEASRAGINVETIYPALLIFLRPKVRAHVTSSSNIMVEHWGH